MSLNEKQKAFCEYYASSFNATESAKKAGYSERTAYSIGCENLKKPEIQNYLAELSNEEKAVLIDAYVNGKPAWKTAQEMGWSDRTVKRRKYKAIEKLCKN